MRARRRIAAALCAAAAVTLTACGAEAATDVIENEMAAVTKAVEHETGTAEQLADAVTNTERGGGMALEVLSAEDQEGNDPTAILKVAVHTEGFPDGFGDVPATTRCYEMTFNKEGLTSTPKDIICPRNPWPDNN